MFKGIEMDKKEFEKMFNKGFDIKDCDDIYKAIGKIIESAQEWERDYKKLAKMLNIEIENIDTSSLNRINNRLFEENKLSQKDYDNLKQVINDRNFINHEFFLEYRQACNEYKEIGNRLSHILFLIHEANDVICNKIDGLKGSSIIRPTVFDEDN